jgi:1,6-anhydro-N-acetylmuramate kinase
LGRDFDHMGQVTETGKGCLVGQSTEEGIAEIGSPGDIESAESHAVVRPFESEYSAATASQHGCLQGDLDRVVAFDVGPANSLVDGVVELITEGVEAMDRDGARGLRGTISPAFLSELLRDEYLAQAPPKSTGRERYGRARSAGILADWRSAEPQSSEDDLLATLVAFTTEGVARACRDWLPDWRGVGERVLVGGGGAKGFLAETQRSTFPSPTGAELIHSETTELT